MAQGGQRIGGFPRLADENRHAAFGQDRAAVAELGRDVDFGGNAGQLFEPVFRDLRGVMPGAAGDHGHAVALGEIDALGQRQTARAGIIIARCGRMERQGCAQDGGLFGDFLGHEMAVAGFVHACLIQVDAADRAVRAASLLIKDFNALAGQDHPVAFLKIGDPVGHRRQRNGVRSQIHFARAMAHGQRRALARADHQVVLALEQEGQRKGPVQT